MVKLLHVLLKLLIWRFWGNKCRFLMNNVWLHFPIWPELSCWLTISLFTIFKNQLLVYLLFLVSLGGDAFNTISSLIRHRKCVHEGAKKTCPICHKELSRNANMKEHIDTVHKGLTNHSCDICGKRFGSKICL